MPRNSTPMVMVVQSDPGQCGAMRLWLESESLRTTAHSCPDDALSWYTVNRADCLVLDAGFSGSNLVERLEEERPDLPVIVTFTESSAGAILRVARLGARDFLPAPVEKEELLCAVRRRLRAPVSRQGHAALSRLSARERDVLTLVLQGHSTKQIAAMLGRVDKTVEFHRHNLMRKLGATNVAQLVRIAMDSGHHAPASPDRPRLAVSGAV